MLWVVLLYILLVSTANQESHFLSSNYCRYVFVCAYMYVGKQIFTGSTPVCTD